MAYCIYLRKSRADTEAEARGEGETLARHEKALTELAKRLNLNVTAIYREIVSGESISARPEMQKLLDEVSNGLWDGVVVMDIDRLARGNGIDQGIISQTFSYAGTKIITPAKIYDPNNEFDEEYFEFGLFMSRREYKIINRRLQRGRIASVKEGKYVGNKPPYGYERIKIQGDKGFTLKVIPEQADIVRTIFEWYTIGVLQSDTTRKHLGVSLIARELNSREIKAYNGGVWTSSTIRDILINPTYIGKVRWNWRPAKKKMVDGKIIQERPRTSDYILNDGLHEAIITQDVFELAQKIMSKNEKHPVRGDKSTQNPLASLVICEKCGRRMQRRPNKKVQNLLICAEPTCNNHSSYLHLVEKHIINTLRQWANDYEIERTLDFQYVQKSEIDYEFELQSIIKSESALNSQLDKAYEAFETGVYDANTFLARSKSIKDKLSNIEVKKQEIQKNINEQQANERILSEFVPRVRKVVEVYETLKTAQMKNDALKEIIDHILYVKDVAGKGHEEDFQIKVFPKLPKA